MALRFSVASHYDHSPEYWLEHNGYTIMASPPDWAKAHKRNLALFAPPASIVFSRVTEEYYTAIYRQTMKNRLAQIDQWIANHDGQHVALLCACPNGQFCHRHLIAKLLLWRGCEQVSLPEELHPLNFCPQCQQQGKVTQNLRVCARPISKSYCLFTLVCPACDHHWQVVQTSKKTELYSEEVHE